ncbi:LCP family protein [Allokutzneria albata]|uniref:Cell envelope-related function transcriptional attenuator common domain-containing protein n=1 Tax=Allokutzneria albata TaxID=211114 RepID=A0A1H0BDX7_ALLAB|nr:LCP family protein [Allokutzneria albata]SDN43623.1 cell envelope-related function transcriptional attenuator common domain-containing protein [Allokutzneria albata]
MPDRPRPKDHDEGSEQAEKFVPLDPAEQPEPAEARRGKGKRIAVNSVRVLAALLSAIALAVSGVSWATLERLQDNVSTTDVVNQLGSQPGAPPARDGATDILLVGSDSRTDAQGNELPASVLRQLRTEANASLNTDTVIVLRIPDNGGKATAISIPRDTYVKVPGFEDAKINAAYVLGKNRRLGELDAQRVTDRLRRERESDQAGRLALGRAVQELTGLRVDHYAEVNLYGFYLLTEALGGVEVCLRQSTSDPDSGANFRRGRQSISGGDALAFVRQRSGLPRGDIDRVVRQQVFMAAVVNKMLSSGTLTDPAKLSALFDAARKSLVFDEGWEPLTLARQFQGLAAGNFEFRTIPVVNINARNDRGQSIVAVDVNAVRAWVTGLVGATPPKMAGRAPLRLDGAAQPNTSEEPITAGGIPCVY